LERAGCRIRSVQSCQGYEVEPGTVVGYIAFGDTAEPPNAQEENQRAYKLLIAAASRVVETMNKDLDIEVSGMCRGGPSTQGTCRFLLTLTAFLSGERGAEGMKEVWYAVAEGLSVLGR